MDTLDQIGIRHRTDKSSKHHGYCDVYDHYFSPLRDKEITLLEIGYGGYEYPDRGGEGVRMWLEYFTRAKIVSLELHPKSNLPDSDRYQFFKGSQDDRARLLEINDQTAGMDIIIDDASHINPLTLKTFEILFPKLRSGGYYIIEDIESSWGGEWCKGANDYYDFHCPTAINLGRELLNDLNAKYIPHYEAEYPIESIHFHQNIIIIKKK